MVNEIYKVKKQSLRFQELRGFTLIELMITLAIVAILMTVAVPSYQSYVVRGVRADTQQTMMEIAAKQEQFMMARQNYTTDLSSTGLNYNIDPAVSDNYDIAVTLVAGPPVGFLVTATGISSLADGVLTLSSTGEKTPAEKWK